MIQRVQSIWLFLASLSLVLLLLLPVASNQNSGSEFWVTVTGLYQQSNGTAQKIETFRPLYTGVLVTALICFAAIFSFRNRTAQKRIISTVIVLIIGLSFWTFSYAGKMPGGLESASFGIGTILPLLSVVFCVLAFRGIRKDEQLLRSADRLR